MEKSNEPTKVIIANYGNGSLALIQWAIEQGLSNLVVLSVDTGWQAQAWQQRLKQVFSYLVKNNITYRHLSSLKSFSESVIDRGSFPSRKFQWCAPFLKGLALNEALDELDPDCTAVIYLAKQKVLSRANRSLVQGEYSEHYQDRVIEYPLLDKTLAERDQLIINAGFEVLAHNSRECFPCIHSTQAELTQMPAHDLKRLQQLEQQVKQTMFSATGALEIEGAERYDMGCGNVWGCGE